MGGKEGGPEPTNSVTGQEDTMAVSDPEPNGQQVPGRPPDPGSGAPAKALATSANMSPPRPGSVSFQGEAGSGFQVGVCGNNVLTHSPSLPPIREQSPIQPSGSPPAWLPARIPGRVEKSTQRRTPRRGRPLSASATSSRRPREGRHTRHGKGPVVVTPPLARGELLPQHSLTATHTAPREPSGQRAWGSKHWL